MKRKFDKVYEEDKGMQEDQEIDRILMENYKVKPEVYP